MLNKFLLLSGLSVLALAGTVEGSIEKDQQVCVEEKLAVNDEQIFAANKKSLEIQQQFTTDVEDEYLEDVYLIV